MDAKKKVAYLPSDRVSALIRGEDLPTTQHGTALFADVSGFSALAEALRRQLGDIKGAEVLIRCLNQAFEALISRVHRYGGSVVGFSGDAITCWFNAPDDLAARRALMAAHEMHRALGELAQVALPDGSQVELSMKVALASGAVQRWVLGVEDIQLIDTLLGAPVDRLAAGEKLAQPGDIIIDATTRQHVAPYSESVTRAGMYAAVTRVSEDAAQPVPAAPPDDAHLSESLVSRWLLPTVNMHFDANIRNLTELRTVVALFLRFTGENTLEQVNAFVRWAQRTIHGYGGNLLQLTFGDKGSYLYAAFGAPISYENNAFRALSAALGLRQPEMAYAVQIGVSTGVMRTGSYGSSTRCTYGVQGDEVNIAARLMTHAPVGQVLVSEFVMRQVAGFFTFSEPRGVVVKGQAVPVQAALLGERINRTIDTIVMPTVKATNLVVRETEHLKLYDTIIESIAGQPPHLIHLAGEAGMGKTYLTASVRKGVESSHDVLWVSAPCDEILNLPLAPYKFFLPRLFGEVSEEAFYASYQDIIRHVQESPRIDDETRQAVLAQLGKNAGAVKPFVVAPPESNHPAAARTINFKVLSRELLWLLRAFSLRRPIVIHLQEGHALDVESQVLTSKLLDHGGGFPITVLLSSRFGNDGQVNPLPPVFDAIPTQLITLNPLSRQGTAQMVAQLLAGEVHDGIITDVYQQSQGNPLYVSVLVKHLQDREHIIAEGGTWRFSQTYLRTELPADVQSHLVTQIDCLGPKLKSVIQAAAVLGQTFDVQVLRTMLDDPETPQYIETGEARGLWSPVGEGRYRFNHSLLRNSAYAMLGQERQMQLHRAAGNAITATYPVDRSRLEEVIAHMRVAREIQETLAH